MKIILTLYPTLILCLLFGFGWSSDYQNQQNYQSTHLVNGLFHPTEIIPLDIVQEMIGQVDQERALTDLRRLTGVEPVCTKNGCYTITGRETGSEGLQWAKDYVYETLLNLHYSVEILDWSLGDYADQNIVARKQGLLYPKEEIYIISHLDGYLVNNPAADDDASGAVSLLELARILSSRYLSRTVVLFFSTGEEHGTLGSSSFVELWSGDQPIDFVLMLTEIIKAYPINLIPEIVTGCT
jgi:hypothetical protein